MQIKNTLLFVLSCCLLLAACNKEDSTATATTGYLAIRFHPTYNGQPLQLNKIYTNHFGETFSISTLKFYTGQFALVANGTETPSLAGEEPYHLFDFAGEGNQLLKRPIAPGSYSALHFIIGVDSARNIGGVQSGALDPLQGMFWTWNSGYIFVKLEGNSIASTAPNNKIEYHIGGFRQPFNAIESFTGLANPGEVWTIAKNQTISFDINVAVDLFFNGIYPLKIADVPVCMTPSETAIKIAANVGSAFELTNVKLN
jgi:hypothetical protein